MLAGVLNASEAANGCEYVISPEQLAHDYSHVQRCDLKTDLLIVATVAGPPVAYSRVFWDQELDGLRRYGIVCHILAEHRATLAAPVFDWAEARIRAIATTQANAGQQVFQTWCENEAGMGWLIEQLE